MHLSTNNNTRQERLLHTYQTFSTDNFLGGKSWGIRFFLFFWCIGIQIILIDDKVLFLSSFGTNARISIQMTRISLIAFWLLSLLRANHTFKLTELFSFPTFSHHCTWTKSLEGGAKKENIPRMNFEIK